MIKNRVRPDPFLQCILTAVLAHFWVRFLVFAQPASFSNTGTTFWLEVGYTYYFFLNFAIVCLFLLLFCLLAGSVKWGCIVFLWVWVLFGCIERFVYSCRGSVFVYSDIFSAKTAASVAGTYLSKIDAVVIASVILLAVMTVLAAFCLDDDARLCRKISAGRLASVLSLAGMFALFIYTPVLAFMNVPVNDFCEKDVMALCGVEAAFFRSFSCTKDVRPFGYTAKKAQALIDRYDSPAGKALSPQTPDVVLCIYNESFTDFSVYKEHASEFDNVLPYYHRLETSGLNARTGYGLMSCFGGGTANSEYEFLTGNSICNSPTRQLYNFDIDHDILALPLAFKAAGYAAKYSHPCYGANWSRDRIYPFLGFDSFDALESGRFQGSKTYRGFVTDEALYDYLLDEIEQGEGRQFLFSVSMQNHGAYSYFSPDDFEGERGLFHPDADFPEETVLNMDEFLNCLKKSDSALEHLITRLEKSDKKVLLFLCGDHQGAVSGLVSDYLNDRKRTADAADFLETSIGSYEKEFSTYETPYLFYANYDADLSFVPDAASSTELGAYVLDAAGLGHSSFYDFLLKSHDFCSTFNAYGYVGRDGRFCLWNKCGDDAIKQWFLDYQYMGYYLTHDMAPEYSRFFAAGDTQTLSCAGD